MSWPVVKIKMTFLKPVIIGLLIFTVEWRGIDNRQWINNGPYDIMNRSMIVTTQQPAQYKIMLRSYGWANVWFGNWENINIDHFIYHQPIFEQKSMWTMISTRIRCQRYIAHCQSHLLNLFIDVLRIFVYCSCSVFKFAFVWILLLLFRKCSFEFDL